MIPNTWRGVFSQSTSNCAVKKVYFRNLRYRRRVTYKRFTSSHLLGNRWTRPRKNKYWGYLSYKMYPNFYFRFQLYIYGKVGGWSNMYS